MESKTEHQGNCLCGAVRIVAATGNDIGVCHCEMCRKWGGGPLLAVECQEDVSLAGEENVSVFSSSEWAERGFCRNCGTHLFYRLKQAGHYAIPVGIFDDGGEWKLAEQIFVEKKPGFYSFAEKTRELTGEEVFALYSNN